MKTNTRSRTRKVKRDLKPSTQKKTFPRKACPKRGGLQIRRRRVKTRLR
jgi:hypothetical protein